MRARSTNAIVALLLATLAAWPARRPAQSFPTLALRQPQDDVAVALAGAAQRRNGAAEHGARQGARMIGVG